MDVKERPVPKKALTAEQIAKERRARNRSTFHRLFHKGANNVKTTKRQQLSVNRLATRKQDDKQTTHRSESEAAPSDDLENGAVSDSEELGPKSGFYVPERPCSSIEREGSQHGKLQTRSVPKSPSPPTQLRFAP